jgi:EAL domain-containing protein (putative c-di-GMP-specific phosphodiesterase class I)
MRDLGDSIKRGRRILPVSVNFSLYEFFSNNFLNRIVETLEKYQVPPTLLEIEITETTSQVNKFLSLSIIKKLKDIGVRILMDDFGIGFSQIENLRQIPFDAVKIDKSFTDRILIDEKTRSIVKFLIELIHDNDMEAIIEGVETKEQVEMLRKLKADTIQGFFYSKPKSLGDYNELLKENSFEAKARGTK